MSVSTNLLPANTAGLDTDVSGWTAGSNTAIARTTSRYYITPASLQLTATASGAVAATTSARVPVTAGAEYTAYAYFSQATATAGRTASVSVSWYSAVTGGTALSTSTSPLGSLPTSSTAWLTPPPILIATAPAGATYASVTVTVAGLSASAVVYADVISFGPPNTLAGNLLPYNTQGSEVTISGWQNLWQTTQVRSAEQSYEGWYSLKLTGSATGTVRAGMVTSVAVTAGTEYLGYAWAYVPRSNAEFHMSIRWYDSTDTLLSATSQTSTITTASTWTRCAAIGVAPAGAVAARLVLEFVTISGGEYWWFDQMALMPSPILTGNLLGYNAQDFEADVTAWSATSGCTVARTTTRAVSGVSSMQVTATGASDPTVSLVGTVPVTPRQAYKIVPNVYHATSTSSVVVDMLFTWFDADGVILESNYSRWTTSAAAGWYAPIGSAVAPANAATLRAGIRIVGAATGAVFNVDSVLVAAGGLGVIADLIDGVYGTAISMQGLTTNGYTSWGLWRMLEGGSMTPVRGSSGDLDQVTVTSDLAVAEDYEAPLGARISYYLKIWTGSAYLATTSEAVVIPEPGDTEVVIKDPSLPARWTQAVVARGGMPDWTRSARQGVNPVRGRARPVVISDVRTSRAGTLSLVTETQDDLDTMWWLLDTGNTLLIQWPSEWGERDVYVQVGDVTEAHLAEYAGYRDRAWSVPLTEVDRPINGITGSADRTWQDVLDGNTDWLAVLVTANTWLDVYTGVQGG